jgi:hypothetical protein
MAKAGTKKQMKENQWRTILPKTRRHDTAPWQETYGMYITGQSWIDELTLCVERMEHKWGAGRLRLLVGAELRDKFDRQRYLTNQAVFHGALEDLRTQCKRMINGWTALDKAADEMGMERCPPEAWDVVGESGIVHVIVRTIDDAKDYRMGRKNVCVYSMDELAIILDAQSPLEAIKSAFEDAEVVGVRRGVGDALSDLETTQSALDDEIPF